MLLKGKGLTDKEKEYWMKTKLRDRAILVFVTYGLRLNELRELNISSFNFSKQVSLLSSENVARKCLCRINDACEKVVKEYIELERPKNEVVPEEHSGRIVLISSEEKNDSRVYKSSG